MGLIANVFTSILSRFLSDEFKAWSPKVAEWLIERAARQLPFSQRDRYLEEWRSHVCDTPGVLGKIIVAIGLPRAARRMATISCGGVMPKSVGQRIAELATPMVGALSIFILAPAMLLIVIMIKLESPGPSVYETEIIGLNGRKFRLLRFRTLRKLPEALAEAKTPPQAPPYQITWIGRIIMRGHLDRLPALLSVVRGNMALVGPPPHSPRQVEQFSLICPEYSERIKVKPGFTGLAQLSRSEDLIEKICLDVLYVRNHNFAMDMKVLMKTIAALIFPDCGDRGPLEIEPSAGTPILSAFLAEGWERALVLSRAAYPDFRLDLRTKPVEDRNEVGQG